MQPLILAGIPDPMKQEYLALAANQKFHVLFSMCDSRDGAARLVAALPTTLLPAEISRPGDPQRVWELCGLYYFNTLRVQECLAIFHSLYSHMLVYQEQKRRYAHKGMPLVWISDCYERLNCPVLSKRYLMLTTCEDAIAHKGTVPAETTGVYFRLVLKYGISNDEISRYAAEVWTLFKRKRSEALFPEWILQQLDQRWMTEYPSLHEAAMYVITPHYVRHLLSCIGGGDGKALEQLGRYLLGSIPGCRASKAKPSHSTDYDILCTLEGTDIDFRSELGRYFICECKDWKRAANVTAFAKFCYVLHSTKCRFGILFSKRGITGSGRTRDAEREQLKVFQDLGMAVVVVSLSDLERLASGANFITMLREKYETRRFDLRT